MIDNVLSTTCLYSGIVIGQSKFLYAHKEKIYFMCYWDILSVFLIVRPIIRHPNLRLIWIVVLDLNAYVVRVWHWDRSLWNCNA
mgnify:FL=1